MLFEGRGEVGYGRITQHDGYFRNAQSFLIEEITRMLHALALIEVEDGGAEHFLETFLEITFVDGHFPAQLLDGKRLTDVLQEHFPGLDYLAPIGFIGEELTLEPFHFLLTYHAFQAVQEQHLALSVDEDVLHAIGVAVVKKGFQHKAGPSAEGEYLGKRRGMTKIEDILAERAIRLPGFPELGEMYRLEAEAKHVNRIDTFRAAGRLINLTGITLRAVLPAIDVAGDAESQLEVVPGGLILLYVIDQHARIFYGPLGMPLISFDGVLYRAGHMLLFLIK